MQRSSDNTYRKSLPNHTQLPLFFFLPRPFGMPWQDYLWRDWDEKIISMARIKREIAVLESGELAENAKEHAGMMDVITVKP